MTRTSTIEKRLDAVERELAVLKKQLAGSSRPGWLRRLRGSMKDMHGFPKMDRLGREARRADRPPDEK